MSFTPTSPRVGNELQFADYQQAMRNAIRAQGFDPDNSFAGQLMMRKAPALRSLAYVMGGAPGTPGGGVDAFPGMVGDFVKYNLGQGGSNYDFSDANVAGRTQQLLRGGGQFADPAYQQWLRTGTEQDQAQTLMALEDLARGGWLPGLRQAATSLRQKDYDTWFDQFTRNPSFDNGRSFIDYAMGQRNWTPPGSGAGGGTKGPGLGSGPLQGGTGGREGAYNDPNYAPPAGASSSNTRYQGGSSSGQAANQAGSFLGQRAGTQTDFQDPGGWEIYQALTPEVIETIMATASRPDAERNRAGVGFSVGDISYDPTQDLARHWWGKNKNASNRAAKGYSAYQQLLNFIRDATNRGWDARTAIAQALARMNRVWAGQGKNKYGETSGFRFGLGGGTAGQRY